MMRDFFAAEKLKYRHTSLKWITVVMPLVTVFLTAWLTHIYFAVDSYNWWYTGLYPGFLGIICSMIGGKDMRKKNYTIWPLPCSMKKIWDAKILVGAMISGFAMAFVVLFTIAAGMILEKVLHVQFIFAPSLEMQIVAGVIIWITTLWEIPFCLFLSQKMGTFLMLVLHMGFYVVLSAFVSLKPWFALFPGAITARLMCPVLGVLPNGLILQPGQMTYSPGLAEINSLFIGIPAALLWFALFWAGSRRWFERQVASK